MAKKYVFLKKYKNKKIGEKDVITDKEELKFLIKTETVKEVDEVEDKGYETLLKKNKELVEENKQLKEELKKYKKEEKKDDV